jgi:O-antigen/teichoic acid export membrane protein
LSSLQRFFKDTLIYGVAAVLPRAILILLVKLHTSTLEADKYAVNTAYYVYAAYFNAFLTYGMETAFFRFFSQEKEKGKVVSTSFLSLLSTTILFLITTLVFSDQISNFFGFKDPLFFKLLVWTITLDTLVVIPYAYLRVTNKSTRFTLYKIVNVLIFAVLNVFFLWFIPYARQNGISLPDFLNTYYNSYPKVLHIFVSGTIASAVTFFLLIPSVFKFKFSFDNHLLKKMLRYSLPIMIGSLAFVTNENLDKLLLGEMLGEKQMGIYAACYKLGVFMTLYIMAFRLGAEPFFFNLANKDNAKETYARILTWFTIIGALFMLIIVVYINLFAGILLSKPEYYQALSIVPVILLANLLLGIYNNLSIWYKLTDNTRFGMYFSIFGASLTIGFNIIFIPIIGFMASAWATLIAYGSMCLLSYFYGKKYYKIPYNIRKSLLYIVISVGLSSISYFYFKENYIFSTLFISVFIVTIAISEKKELKILFK